MLPNQILPAIVVANMQGQAVNGGTLAFGEIKRRLKPTDNDIGRILSIGHSALPR